jgi:malate dehydrogenase
VAKVSVIGSGNVGASAAYFLAARNFADVVMVDVVPGLPQGKAMDFQHASPSRDYSVGIVGTNDYSAIADSDVVVHTAGIARKPGMDRMDLLRTNVGIARTASENIVRFAPKAVVVVVSNPLDVIAMVVARATGFPRERVVGMAGILDSTRFRFFIAERLAVLPGDVQAMVLGGHGDSMVPVSKYTTVAGFPLDELLPPNEIKELSDRTRKGGAEVINYLKTGSAYYAPAASAVEMVEAILKDEKRIAPASALLQGEYGYHDLYLGVPVLLGAGGVERIFELPLSEDEKSALDNSVVAVKKGLADLDEIDVG